MACLLVGGADRAQVGHLLAAHGFKEPRRARHAEREGGTGGGGRRRRRCEQTMEYEVRGGGGDVRRRLACRRLLPARRRAASRRSSSSTSPRRSTRAAAPRVGGDGGGRVLRRPRCAIRCAPPAGRGDGRRGTRVRRAAHEALLAPALVASGCALATLREARDGDRELIEAAQEAPAPRGPASRRSLTRRRRALAGPDLGRRLRQASCCVCVCGARGRPSNRKRRARPRLPASERLGAKRTRR